MATDLQLLEAVFNIVKAMLPSDVRLFVSGHCTLVIWETHLAGMTIPTQVTRSWVIILNAEILKRYGRDDVYSIVAHEIAHAWLRHRDIYTPNVEEENAAARQVAAWGFHGFGAKPFAER